MLEAIGVLLAAATLVLSRLDRREDAAHLAPDLYLGLLQLDRILDEWLVAAEATNAAAAWLSGSDDWLRYKLGSQLSPARAVLARVGGAGPDLHEPSDASVAALRRLIEIYAPEHAAQVSEWARSRYELVNQMMDDLTWARQSGVTIADNPWEGQLSDTYADLKRAQDRLRDFLRENFRPGSHVSL
jgi:hypothetical protein